MVVTVLKMGERKITITEHMAAAAPAAKNTWKCMRSNLLTMLIILGIVLGLSFGAVLKNSKDDKYSQKDQVYVKFGGEIFLRMLKAVSLPLILTSVVAALGSLDLKLTGKVGVRMLFFYFVSTMCAIFLGIILVVTIHPGVHNKDDKDQVEWKPPKIFNSDVMMDMIRNMFPSNLIHATMYEYQTILDMPTLTAMKEKLGENKTLKEADYPTKSKNFEGTNFLGVLVYSTVFGLALASLGSYGKPVLKLFRCLSQLMMVISNWILWLAPAGVFCLLAGKVVESGDASVDIAKTGMYLFTVLFGLSLHGFILLPIVYYLFTGSHPFKLLGNAIQALATAFGTASSIATLPATLNCMEEKHGVDPRVSRFVLPLGAAMNMDGTALHLSVAAIFLMQLQGVAMSFEAIIAVSFIVTISTFGVSGIPHAGITIMTMLMNALGLPAESIIFLIPVDWILDRFRTAVNVLGDTLCAGAVDKLCKDELDQLPAKLANSDDRTSTTTEDV